MTDDLHAELAALKAREVDLDAQIEPLVAARARVRADMAAAWALLAEQAQSDAEILALSYRTPVAATRLDAEVRALHPYFYSTERWHPDEMWRTDIPDDDMLVGPHLALTGRRSLDVAQAPSLVEALVRFADRFCREFPGGGEFPGMIRARILDDDCGSIRSYVLWYEPSLDGRAVLVDAQWGSGRTLAVGPITEVVTEAIEKAAEPTDEDERGRW